MKRTICLLLLAAVLCAAAPPAEAAEEQNEQDEAIVISYDAIEELVALANPDVLSVSRAYETMRLQLVTLEGKLSDLNDGVLALSLNASVSLSLLAPAAQPMQTAIKDLGEALKDRDSDINNIVAVKLYAARLMYLNYYQLCEQSEILRRDSEEAQREFLSLKQKYEAGIVSRDVVDKYEKLVKYKNDAVKTASKSADAALRDLADFLGVLSEITLDGLPEFEISAEAERDFDADRALYVLYSIDVQTKKTALDKTRKEYEKSYSATDRYAYNNAKADYDRAQAKAKLDFPFVFENLADAFDDWLTSAIVTDAENDLKNCRRQFERGIVSKNSVLAAERALDDAKSNSERMRVALIMKLLEYEFNLTARN